MKPKSLFSLLVFLALSINLINGQVVIDTVIDYDIINQTIHEKVQQYGAEQVLVVLDIDNTILTSDTELGSDFWYQWQTDKLPVKPRPDQKLDMNCLFDEAISLLYALGTMSLTDSLLPGYIGNWQNSGVTVFALTSRNPQSRPATERELELCDVDLSLTSIRNADGREVPYHTAADSNLSYEHGIFMTTGANKGIKLADIIKRSGRSFKAIIMVDDTWKNIDHVQANASNYGAVEVILFFYTKINTERLARNNNTIFTQEQAEKLDDDWDELIREINAIFPERVNKSVCSKRVCISINDLPLVSYGISDSSYQKAVVAKMVRTLNENKVPAIGFVNEGKLYEDGKLIPVTISVEDTLFAKAYHKANQRQDTALMHRIGRDYLSYMEQKLVFFEGQSDSLFGRNISQILLIHASLLNADYLGQLIDIYRDQNYFFVSMDQALEDPAFLTPVTVYGNLGISWLDRWALSRGKKGEFFKNDPVTPEYIHKLAE